MLERSSQMAPTLIVFCGVEKTYDTRIGDVVREMERTLAQPIRIRELSAFVRLSPSRFTHLFREETGMSPTQFLQALRMEQARQLLDDTPLSVRMVMILVGSRDPSHFAKQFRRRFGLAPREYRRKRTTQV